MVTRLGGERGNTLIPCENIMTKVTRRHMLLKPKWIIGHENSNFSRRNNVPSFCYSYRCCGLVGIPMNALYAWAIRWNVSPEAFKELAQIYAPQGVDSIPGGSEAMTQAGLRVFAPKVGCALWRNNSGAMDDGAGRIVRFGLANDSKRLNDVFKSSDLIGITPVEWQGRTFGVFTAVECKAPDFKGPRSDREVAQNNFLTTVESMGGIGLFATSVDHYRARVGR